MMNKIIMDCKLLIKKAFKNMTKNISHKVVKVRKDVKQHINNYLWEVFTFSLYQLRIALAVYVKT